MRRTLPVFVVLIALAGACQPSPDDTIRALSAASQAGDWERFAQSLTRRSRAVFHGAIAAAPEGRPLLAPGPLAAPMTLVASQVEGDTALVEVQASEASTTTLVLLREEGRWRVDLFECQRLWARERLRGRGALEFGEGG